MKGSNQVMHCHTFDVKFERFMDTTNVDVKGNIWSTDVKLIPTVRLLVVSDNMFVFY
jgi:hypothetical protein